MPNTEIVLPKKDSAVAKPESVALSEPWDPDSSPVRHQSLSEDPSDRFRSNQDNQQDEFWDRARRKRKREECRVSRLQIPEPLVAATSPPGEYSGEAYETPRSIVGDVEVRNPSCCPPPPPPKKPKAAPAMKRRALWIRSSLVLLDVSREVESMFPISVLENFGKKIRRTCS